MTTRLVIIGAGGHGRETLDIVEACNEREPMYEFVGFCSTVVDQELIDRRRGSSLGYLDALREIEASYVIGIGTSDVRREIDHDTRLDGRDAVVLVHPASSTGSDLRISPGVILAAGARLTTNIELGRHTHLNVNAVVSHDCVVGDYVTLSPGVLINGNVTLGDGVFLGTGAIVLPGRTIGAWARIGAGAVVTEDVPSGRTAVGVPARLLEH
jgi:sugar O-acyltransferase (sialic acid O-acetyltransferase NeuD family)